MTPFNHELFACRRIYHIRSIVIFAPSIEFNFGNTNYTRKLHNLLHILNIVAVKFNCSENYKVTSSCSMGFITVALRKAASFSCISGCNLTIVSSAQYGTVRRHACRCALKWTQRNFLRGRFSYGGKIAPRVIELVRS